MRLRLWRGAARDGASTGRGVGGDSQESRALCAARFHRRIEQPARNPSVKFLDIAGSLVIIRARCRNTEASSEDKKVRSEMREIFDSFDVIQKRDLAWGVVGLFCVALIAFGGF